jgi:Cof subfamily protein (haloacid dehalogenase superfamily)
LLTDSTFSTIRLLAVDIDGTLLSSNHTVLPEVRRAFADGRAAGLILILASARGPGALKHIMEDLGHAGLCVCFSGAWVGTIDPARSVATVAQELTIPLETALAIAGAALAAGLVPSWHTGRTWTVPSMSPYVRLEMHVTSQTPIINEDLASAGAPNKILLIGAREILIEVRDDLALRHGDSFDAFFSHETYLEFLPKEADKAQAILALAREEGIGRESIAAVGDAQNDLGMIRAAGLGVAMFNAILEVKQAAKWITASNDDAGVAKLIDRILEARRN